MSFDEGTKLVIMAPVVRGKKGTHQTIFEDAKKSGFVRVRVDGNMYELEEEITLEKNKKHNIEIVVDRIIIRAESKSRVTDSLETALKLGGGLVIVQILGGEEITFSQNYACTDCGISIDELAPRMFSFNSPFGACPECSGLGFVLEFSPDLIIPNKNLSFNEGAVKSSFFRRREGIFFVSAMEIHYDVSALYLLVFYKLDSSVKLKSCRACF